MEILKAFKFRIYPNRTQQTELAKQFGSARFVYNLFLNTKKQLFFDTGKSVGYAGMTTMLTEIKKTLEFSWLREADSQVLQQSLKDLDNAFERFFEKHKTGTLPPKGDKPRKDGMPKGYPTFWSKHDDQSIRYPQRFRVNDKRIYLPKVGWAST